MSPHQPKTCVLAVCTSSYTVKTRPLSGREVRSSKWVLDASRSDRSTKSTGCCVPPMRPCPQGVYTRTRSACRGRFDNRRLARLMQCFSLAFLTIDRPKTVTVKRGPVTAARPPCQRFASCRVPPITGMGQKMVYDVFGMHGGTSFLVSSPIRRSSPAMHVPGAPQKML